MKYIITSLILILSLQGFSQSIDATVNKYIHDSLQALPSDTIKPFNITGNVSIFPDTLTIPPNTMYQIDLAILYRNTTTGVILTGKKTVTIQRSGAGDYDIVSDPNPDNGSTITKSQWTMGIINKFLVIRVTGAVSSTTTPVRVKGVVSKYYRLMSSQ